MTAPKRPRTYQSMSIAGGIRAAAGRAPDKFAIGLGDRKLTYRQLIDRIHRVANATVGGMKLTGGRAAILAPNCLEYVELICGLAEGGATAVTINPRLTVPEVEFICNDSQTRVLFVHPSCEDTARAVQSPSLQKIVKLGEQYERWLAKASTVAPSSAIEEWQTFAMHYTAGTTGKPKGVLVPHRSRILTFFGMAAEYGCYGPSDRSLGIAPMFHGAGLAFALAPVFFGGYLQVLPAFEPENVLSQLKQGGHTSTFMVPTHFNAIFQLDPKLLDLHRAPASLRTIVSNAAPLSQVAKERIVDQFGEGILHETYGSTEAGIVTNLRPDDQLRKKQCVGLPFPYTRVRLLDEDGWAVPRGEVGELFSNSPYLFNGYWQRPDETRTAMREAWLSVGDLARQDEEGYFYLVDRKRDVIISGGVNVYPREVEEVLHAHPSIIEAAVVGVPDDYWGEAVKAFVVARDERKLDACLLLDYCRQNLAGYKIPKELEFLDSLPRNAAGKVLKGALRDKHGKMT